MTPSWSLYCTRPPLTLFQLMTLNLRNVSYRGLMDYFGNSGLHVFLNKNGINILLLKKKSSQKNSPNLIKSVDVERAAHFYDVIFAERQLVVHVTVGRRRRRVVVEQRDEVPRWRHRRRRRGSLVVAVVTGCYANWAFLWMFVIPTYSWQM